MLSKEQNATFACRRFASTIKKWWFQCNSEQMFWPYSTSIAISSSTKCNQRSNADCFWRLRAMGKDPSIYMDNRNVSCEMLLQRHEWKSFWHRISEILIQFEKLKNCSCCSNSGMYQYRTFAIDLLSLYYYYCFTQLVPFMYWYREIKIN